MDQKKATGIHGEQYVAEYLLQNGYIMKARNFHSRYGEVDLIAEKNGVLAFIEVKTRKKGAAVRPEEAVTRAKQQKLLKTAFVYLQQKNTALQPRFDVAEVWVSPSDGKPVEIRYIINAFGQEEKEYAAF